MSEPLIRRFIVRHRLRKQDPSAAVSDAVTPIVYYLDRGTPEPIRSALLDGARWWGQAFEAAGYRDAFRVELLPEGADPLDVALQRDPVGAPRDARLELRRDDPRIRAPARSSRATSRSDRCACARTT